MSTMTDITQKPALSPNEKAVLAYYTREGLDILNEVVYAGLTVSQFRAAREALLRRGTLTQVDGRYRPTALIELQAREGSP